MTTATTLTHQDIHQFERLVSKLVKSADLPQSATFTPCSGGLQAAAVTKGAALTMTIPARNTTTGFTLPWTAVRELAVKKRDTIELTAEGGSVRASYTLGGVPQHRVFTTVTGKQTDTLPPKPENLLAHTHKLFDALVDAAKCTDPDSMRYVLSAICLRATNGQIIASDGKQALLQGGFSFPWSDDVLCPASKIFGANELREQDDVVQFGANADWLYFETGSVAFWIKPLEGKYPQFDRFTDDVAHFTWATLDRGDTSFAAPRIENLPGKSDDNSPVYVTLNGHVAFRGHDTAQQTATDLRLSRSWYEGKPAAVPMNRRYLQNALYFGISRIGIDPDDKTPIVCYGERLTFIVMPLELKEPKVEAHNIAVLASDATATAPVASPKPLKVAKAVKSVAAQNSDLKGCKAVVSEPYSCTATNDVIADSEGLCRTLADTLGVTKRLVRNLKAQRRQNKLMRATIASLKQLQSC